MFSVKGIIIAVLVVLLVGVGWQARDWKSDRDAAQLVVAQQKLEIDAYKTSIERMRVALETDSTASQTDSVEIKKMERDADEVKKLTSDGVALPSDDVGRLLRWWSGEGGVDRGGKGSRSR